MHLKEALNDVLSTTDLTNHHEVTKAVLDRMDTKEQLDALAEVLPVWVATRMKPSDPYKFTEKQVAPALSPVEVPEPVAEPAKKPNPPWFQSWSNKRFTGADGNVLWMDFSIADARANIERRNVKISQMQANNAWYEKVETTLAEHGVEVIGALPAAIRTSLEKTYPG